MLGLQQNYRIVESEQSGTHWRVDVVGYDYVTYDAEQREVLLHHWHPRGNSPVSTPHLHLEQGARGREIAINQGSELFIHRPNGQIRDRDSYGNDPFPPRG